MEPISAGAVIALANASIKLAQAAGLVHDEARELARDTNAKVTALLEQDFNVALSMLEASAHAIDEERQHALLAKAVDKFEDAEATGGLNEHLRGFSAAMCAALSIRLRSDGEEARLWVRRAVEHYDRALRRIYQQAETAVKANADAAKVDRWSAVAGPITGIAARSVMSRRAVVESQRVPSHALMTAINDAARDVHVLAAELGLDTDARATSVEVARSMKGARVLEARLVENG
jgi:hypothetical protein